MANEDLSLTELVGRAYARAIPPKKFVKLIQNRLEQNAPSDSEDDLAAAFIHHLLPHPPSILLTYLSQILTTPLVTSKTIFVHLLFYLSESDAPTISVLTSITNVLLSNPTGLEEPTIIPSLLSRPSKNNKVPDVGTSASASTPPPQTSTLSLLIPLFRLCASTPSSSLSVIVGRVISLLAPFPAPSLDVGLEAGGLLPVLPEEIVTPLRNCLGGLMADLSTHDTVARDADVQMGDASQLQTAQTGASSGVDTPLPLRPIISFLLHQAYRSSKWSHTVNYDQPHPSSPINHIVLIKMGSYLTPNPSEYLVALLETCVQDVVGKMAVGTIENVRSWQFLVEGIPNLLKWWKENSDPNWPIPTDLTVPLGAVLQGMLPAMTSFSDLVTQTYSSAIQSAEAEEESSGFTALEGWQIVPLQEVLVSKLVQLEVISSDEASVIALGTAVHAFTPGESLLNRLAGESTPHLPPLVHFIDYAFGAAPSFATELVKVIQSAPQIPPPENLFVHVSSQPKLLTALTSYISPPSLLDLLVKQLLDGPLDEAARAEDPQGYLIRYGEGVMFVEAAVAHFELELPDLLHDARRAISLVDLESSHKECLNGWVKAIFGSDGIEDQILLATSPQDLCKLTPTLIQQAIAAVTSGQIDLDTLHSGLSYFSQPLLSWCLGGVIGWLCREIERQGLLSALHLVVLQDLVMGHACPESLLRVNREGLNRLLGPNSGLGPVLESSGFDVAGVRNKLDLLGLNSVPSSPPQPLSTALQLIRHVEVAPTGWQTILLSSLDASLSSARGSTSTVIDIADDILFDASQLNGLETSSVTGGKTLVRFAPILFALQLREDTSPLLLHFIRNYLPTIFAPRSKDVSADVLVGIIKNSIHLSAALWGESRFAQSLLDELVDSIDYQMGKSVLNADETQAKRSAAAKKTVAREERLTPAQREVVENLIRGLRDDEGLRARWGEVIGRLDRLG
ncbi:hypothetical protein CI109_105592 [Kwoniella shandongensis]|uniref:Mediator of RNA polymerase II transcription subunit 5 n=1 Tax=Kwoniella shandongensis TaxID=1734106 RepID=A0A5M6C2R2_9TREE|nr:uncharacterized protein CI109_002309 [Kwoniella shandongensis]KAA5529416.1 hypothetical protein CI109_002309 [Kwoniella shandongensis]